MRILWLVAFAIVLMLLSALVIRAARRRARLNTQPLGGGTRTQHARSSRSLLFGDNHRDFTENDLRAKAEMSGLL